MVYRELTQNHFDEFKADYAVYGTHIETDAYNSKQSVKDSQPKGTINVMWQPMTDYAFVAEYGRDVETMLYCICYDDTIDVAYGDIVTIRNADYEVVGLKYFNTYTRIDIKKQV